MTKNRFFPERLTEAREVRDMTMLGLGELVGKSASSISAYENEHQQPPMDVVIELARALRVPPEFFFTPPRPGPDGPTFFRSMSAASKRSRRRADRRIDWVSDLLRFVDSRVEIPGVSLPEPVEVPWRALTRRDIEMRAAGLRTHWNLGMGPLSNVVWLAEEAGFVVVRDRIGDSKLDAHHRWCAGRPVIVLNTDKESAVRSRFDCSHEIAHADIHRTVAAADLRGSDRLKQIERQANQFAAGFLMPAETFAQEVGSVSLDSLLQMKLRWKVSLAALIRRCLTLDIISRPAAERLWKAKSARGWTKREPLDDEIFPEQPRLLAGAITVALSHGLSSRERLVAETGLPKRDIETLAGFGPGYLDDEPTRGLQARSPSGIGSGSELTYEEIHKFLKDADTAGDLNEVASCPSHSFFDPTGPLVLLPQVCRFLCPRWLAQDDAGWRRIP